MAANKGLDNPKNSKITGETVKEAFPEYTNNVENDLKMPLVIG